MTEDERAARLEMQMQALQQQQDERKEVTAEQFRLVHARLDQLGQILEGLSQKANQAAGASRMLAWMISLGGLLMAGIGWLLVHTGSLTH